MQGKKQVKRPKRQKATATPPGIGFWGAVRRAERAGMNQHEAMAHVQKTQPGIYTRWNRSGAPLREAYEKWRKGLARRHAART